MKKTIVILLSACMLLCFYACEGGKTEPTTASTTTAAVSENTTRSPSQTTEPEVDYSYIYNGYWYQNEGNKVVVLHFQKDGTVSISTFRRKNIAATSEEPDSVVQGSFTDKADGTFIVYPDSDSKDTSDVYDADSASASLTCVRDDPEGSSTIELVHFDTLSKANARSVLVNNG